MDKSLKAKIEVKIPLCPGARKKSQTPGCSGEDLGEELVEAFEKVSKEGGFVEVIFDGTCGAAGSYIDEAFGILSKNFPLRVIENRLVIVSREAPEYEQEAWEAVEYHSQG